MLGDLWQWPLSVWGRLFFRNILMTGYIDGHCRFHTLPQPKLASPCYTRRDLQSLPAHMPHYAWHCLWGTICGARAPWRGRITWRSARVLRGRAWATRGSSVSIYIEIHRFENIIVNHTKKWQHTKHKHMHTRKYLWYKCNTTRIKL